MIPNHSLWLMADQDQQDHPHNQQETLPFILTTLTLPLSYWFLLAALPSLIRAFIFLPSFSLSSCGTFRKTLHTFPFSFVTPQNQQQLSHIMTQIWPFTPIQLSNPFPFQQAHSPKKSHATQIPDSLIHTTNSFLKAFPLPALLILSVYFLALTNVFTLTTYCLAQCFFEKPLAQDLNWFFRVPISEQSCFQFLPIEQKRQLKSTFGHLINSLKFKLTPCYDTFSLSALFSKIWASSWSF